MRRTPVLTPVWLLMFAIFLSACDTERAVQDEAFTLTIRLAAEPDNLNPTRSRSIYATPIEGLIMYPLAEHDPQTFELSPLIVKSLATTDEITEGAFAGGTVFHYEIREEARWDDGS
ncbi:MAG: hypothetical protein R3301_16975, partial [Saprospiraceae bacterium]|nr:hypothetical protein [Saprospiraceae bacterium]